MTTEHATEDTVTPTPPPVLLEGGKRKPLRPAPAPASASDEEEKEAPGTKVSKPIQQLHFAEDATIKEIVEQLGSEGSFKIQVKRMEPERSRDPISGNYIATAGHLGTFSKALDADWLAENFGGGKYELIIKKRTGQYVAHRVIVIPGDPRIDAGALPRSSAPPEAAQQSRPAEQPQIAMKAFEMLAGQLDKKQPTGMDPALVSLFQSQIDSRDKAMAEMRAEMRSMREEPKDPHKDKLLERLIDGDSARILAIKTQFDAEMRTVKENHEADMRRIRQREEDTEKRLTDRYDREKAEMRASHERELGMLRLGFDTTMKNTASSHEIALAAIKSSFETQMRLADGENRRLERDNAELRGDVKDLRAVKDKSLIQQMKEIKEVKDAIGFEDGGDEKGAVGQIVEAITNPGTLEAITSMVRPPPPPQQNPPAAPAQQQGRRVVQHKDGNKYFLEEDGTLTGPLRKKKKPAAPAEPGEPEIPETDPEKVAMVVGLLEKAFVGGQEPALVSQSFKAHVPDEILQAIRALSDQHASLDRGIDAFMSKVAKLQGSSPLSSQGGRNWVRKVGRALVGE